MHAHALDEDFLAERHRALIGTVADKRGFLVDAAERHERSHAVHLEYGTRFVGIDGNPVLPRRLVRVQEFIRVKIGHGNIGEHLAGSGVHGHHDHRLGVVFLQGGLAQFLQLELQVGVYGKEYIVAVRKARARFFGIRAKLRLKRSLRPGQADILGTHEADQLGRQVAFRIHAAGHAFHADAGGPALVQQLGHEARAVSRDAAGNIYEIRG